MSGALRLTHCVGPRIVALIMGLVVLGGLFVGVRPAGASASEVTATGRFAYVDDTGATIGIRNAPVTLCDDDGAFGCSGMAVGTTDSNGFFTLTGQGGDPFNDLPDPLVKVTATGPSGFIQPLTLVDYCFTSLPFNNAGNQSINFGTITPAIGRGCNITGGSTAGTDGAWQLWNNVREAWEFMRGQTLRNPGRDVPPVRVLWPDTIGNASFYRGPLPALDSGSISVSRVDAFREPVIFHEYGHHILQWFGESPLPDYNNSTCDSVNFLVFGGHCFWRSEKGVVAWTEGWPDFLSEVLTTALGKNQTASSLFGCDPVIPSICGSVEGPPLPSPDSNLRSVEGTVAAVLLDLMDSNMDNRNNDNSTDRLNLTFGTIWDVFQGFDPDPFTAHNRILDVDELWNGFAALRPTELNRVSEIYHENGLSKPSADLTVTASSLSASTVAPGTTINVSDTTANAGAVRTGVSSVTRLSLQRGVRAFPLVLGSRTVGDLASGGGASSGSTSVTIPSSTPAGDYSLTVCADSGATVFESNESNNCWTHDIVVPAPTVSIGDATVTEGNSGTTIMSFPVSLSVPSANPVTVDFTTVDGTAKAPGDYSVKSENLRFEAGQTNKTVEVLVNGDLRNERDETLGGMLSNSVGAAISDGTGVGTIVNDDPIPSVSISDVRLSEGDSGLKDFSFKVSLSARSGREVRVNWRTVNGSAYGSDYVPDSQLLKIPAGYLSKNVVVKVKGDVTVEINETFRVVLSAPVNATIADGSGRATIVNDD